MERPPRPIGIVTTDREGGPLARPPNRLAIRIAGKETGESTALWPNETSTFLHRGPPGAITSQGRQKCPTADQGPYLEDVFRRLLRMNSSRKNATAKNEKTYRKKDTIESPSPRGSAIKGLTASKKQAVEFERRAR